MDGLLSYANIFSFWVYQFQELWYYLNLPLVDALYSFVDFFIENFSGNTLLSLIVDFVADFLGPVLAFILQLNGLPGLTVLGFFFACMGSLFFVYFVFTVIQWILKTIPLV